MNSISFLKVSTVFTPTMNPVIRQLKKFFENLCLVCSISNVTYILDVTNSFDFGLIGFADVLKIALTKQSFVVSETT